MRRRDFVTHAGLAAAAVASGRAAAGSLLRDSGASSGDITLRLTAELTAYQTAFLKLGLRRLGLPDPWALPAVADGYGPLAWWISRQGRVDVPRFDTQAAIRYPYLVWAEDHFHTSANGLLGNRDYPLTWEAHASQADYEGMGSIGAAFTEARLCAPHTWHGAEMFLLLKGVETAP